MDYIQGTRATGARDRRRLGRGRGAPARGAAAPAAGEGGGGGLTVQGLPLVKPPYGRITAIDLNKGEIVWQIAHGETPDNIRNHPGAQGLDDPAHRPAGHASARWSPRRW